MANSQIQIHLAPGSCRSHSPTSTHFCRDTQATAAWSLPGEQEDVTRPRKSQCCGSIAAGLLVALGLSVLQGWEEEAEMSRLQAGQGLRFWSDTEISCENSPAQVTCG